jgi:hypothetical protein
MKEHTIAERELYAAGRAIVDTVRSATCLNVRLKRITLYIDNTNCVSWLTKRRAKNYFVNALLRDTISALGSVELVVSYIRSEENPADRPSREPGNYRSVRPPHQLALADGQKPRGDGPHQVMT